MLNIDQQVQWLLQGTDDVVSPAQLKEKLEKSSHTGIPLTVKLGVDPTAPDIHLGHTVVLEKLRQFQELGHRVVFLIGDMTGRIGDPTDRAATRKQLSADDVRQFAKTYVDQAKKILDPDRLILHYNSEWLEPMQLADIIRLMAQTTVARILERDDFHNRFTEHVPIHLHELLYPLMQAYDSVVLKADVELGGTDQRFNIMTARQIQEAYGLEPEVGVFLPILEGTDGVRRMGKSLGNYVGISEPPQEMFGKIMSIPDTLITRWAVLLLGEDAHIWNQRVQTENPRNVKADLANRLVARFWGQEKANEAQEQFDRTFREHQVPEDMPVLNLPTEPWQVSAIELVASLPDISSKQEARRMLQQGAVAVDGNKIGMTDTVEVKSGSWIRVGRRRYYRFQKR
ncbi:tyrosine--tRNA ligase [Sulfobacillus thermosulfidooxidans]|uniref:tyrosine--tRNA ligase n=1 Tax=Sulfobacillus thermosulfidooxidans TaxID=28034 RepID=UPI00096B9BCC|nr:tyrosine--tRNA ligase [Sulfobacillus thermosulfidooxidans]OLZ09823.1 tyrosine--tRNA ligase [Sulfobacillus thermosulfidooxidans]OLZ15871.1 tyrosine--tRNA ligase [Sulfobacillus thermosulfidooxidans]OLZ18282.1 tyrosine--tRNA ligase [Sulfobacillus thermosulfidooxidans]